MNRPALLRALNLLQSLLVRVRRNVGRVVRYAGHNSENLHQLRVSARKCHAVLGLLKKHLPRRQRRWWKQTFRVILHTTGTARDLDVLANFQAQTPAPESEHELQRRRNKARRKVAKSLDNLSPKKLKRRIESVISKPMKKVNQAAFVGVQSFEQQTEQRLRAAISRFFKAAAGNIHDERELHQLRIAAKKLRYLLEAIVDSGMASPAFVLPQELIEIQQALGTIHDHQCAANYFHRLARSTVAPDIQSHALAAQSRHELESKTAIESLKAWWTEAYVEQLKHKCDQAAHFLLLLRTDARFE